MILSMVASRPKTHGEKMSTQRSNLLHIPLVQDQGGIERLKDIVVPDKFFKRILFGVPLLDEVFGGEMPGILPGSTYLFTGDPGAGKSTMALQMADLLESNAGRNVMYNIGEES